jgi:hypothetical protein
MTLALAALLAVAVNDAVSIPPGKCRARTMREFLLMSTGAGVRAVLVTREDDDHMESGRRLRALAATPVRQNDRLEYKGPRELAPRRRAAVVALSVLFFVSVSLYAFRRLWHAMPGRTGQPPPA